MPRKPRRKESRPKIRRKYYEKARKWYRTREEIKVSGFEPVGIKRSGVLIELKAKDSSVVKTTMDIHEEPLFAFRATDGSKRYIIVGKKIEKFKEQIKIRFNAYYGIPQKESNFLIPMRFVHAYATYIPEEKIILTSNFQWLHSDRKHTQLSELNRINLTPSWLKGKGFGLFLDSLRQIEISKLGAKKWFTTIMPNPHSRAFAELRGFRKLKKEEAEYIQENFAQKETIADIMRHWRVKDITPIKGYRRGREILPKEKE